jgi:Family of unknown function (DUF6308)
MSAWGTGDARSLVEDGREADQAWRLLKAQDDVGWVTAGKLLARKRRHLIPVWDQVVRCALGRPEGAWLWLDKLLRADEAVVLRRLEDSPPASRAALSRTAAPDPRRGYLDEAPRLPPAKPMPRSLARPRSADSVVRSAGHTA